MNRKAQSAPNVLIYILGFVAGALILIYGYQAINYVIHRGEDAMMIKLEQSLENTIQDTARLPGTVRFTPSLTAPSRFEKICILDITKSCDKNYQDFGNDGALICDAYDDLVGNVFFLPFEAATINIPEIRLPEGQNTLCIPFNGPIKLKVTGQGRTSLIEPYQE